MGDQAPSRRDEELGEVLKKDLDSWQRVNMKTPLSRSLFPDNHREAWVNLFIKYNTPLPSSAVVERLFSVAGDIMRLKRASLSASNFEMLVFLKVNLGLLGYKEDKRPHNVWEAINHSSD